jgi:mRNA interferase RelE/StbE
VPYDVRLLSAAERDLKAIAKKATATQRRQLIDALTAMRGDPLSGDVKALVGKLGLRRRRVGDFRIVFQVRDRVLLVAVVVIGNRKDVYSILDRRDLGVLGLTDAECLAVLAP